MEKMSNFIDQQEKDVCRICGKNEGANSVTDIFGAEGRKKMLLTQIRFCFSTQVLDVHSKDGLPKGICFECQTALANTFQNARKIHQMQIQLKEKFASMTNSSYEKMPSKETNNNTLGVSLLSSSAIQKINQCVLPPVDQSSKSTNPLQEFKLERPQSLNLAQDQYVPKLTVKSPEELLSTPDPDMQANPGFESHNMDRQFSSKGSRSSNQLMVTPQGNNFYATSEVGNDSTIPPTIHLPEVKTENEKYSGEPMALTTQLSFSSPLQSSSFPLFHLEVFLKQVMLVPNDSNETIEGAYTRGLDVDKLVGEIAKYQTPSDHQQLLAIGTTEQQHQLLNKVHQSSNCLESQGNVQTVFVPPKRNAQGAIVAPATLVKVVPVPVSSNQLGSFPRTPDGSLIANVVLPDGRVIQIPMQSGDRNTAEKVKPNLTSASSEGETAPSVNMPGIQNGVQRFSDNMSHRPPPPYEYAHKTLTDPVVMMVHSKDQFECSKCQLKITDRNIIDQHCMAIHGNQNIVLKCKNCPEKFSSPSLIEVHKCPMVINNTSSHLLSKNSVTTKFECSQCQKFFASKATLRRHQQNNHSELEKTAKSSYKCNSCLESFSLKSALATHMKKHFDSSLKAPLPGEYLCAVCGGSFSQKTQLELHSCPESKQTTHANNVSAEKRRDHNN